MTTENNAAQPGQDPIREAIQILTEEAESIRESHTHKSAPDNWTREPEAKADYDRMLGVAAALSKLRAEGVQAGDERESFSDWAWRKDGLAIGHMDGQAAAWEAWQERARRAALASAPVAGDAQSSIRVFVKDGKASRPASSGARLPDGFHTFYAAPQASEAVRNAGIELAAAWVDKRRHDFDHAHGYMESDTGAWSFGRGDGATAKEEYSAELAEIAEGLRALKAQTDKDGGDCAKGAGEERPSWMTCETRGWMVRESLARNAKGMRADEKRCRNAYNEDYMGAPTRYLADVFAEAAAVFEKWLGELPPQKIGGQ
ncbi:hypothetical protein [Achromobacter marplatensis]|uniref:hypothetical protein n=1 Tax=Achromobacter marplatensis TaxID=470868 RepID=UPI0028F012AC|nr:hypothetical protein [Achromobacter marplatensis]